MINLPDYWLKRPNAAFDANARIAFDELLSSSLATGECPSIFYNLPWPKWQFLCYLGDTHEFALHGSGSPNITEFEPRQSNDLNAANGGALARKPVKQFPF